MTTSPLDYAKQVDKLLIKADMDFIRFAHVIRGWGGMYSEAIADSLSMIVLQGDVFRRALTHIHAPTVGRVEIRNVYRAGYNGDDLNLIDPYVIMERLDQPLVDVGRVAYGDALKSLQRHLRSLYGEVSKVVTPAFDVINYLTRRSWWVCHYDHTDDNTTLHLTDGTDVIRIRLNYIPMCLDKRAVADYVKYRKGH